MFIGQEIESLREIGISRRANPVRNLARALKSPAQNSTRYFRPHPCEDAREWCSHKSRTRKKNLVREIRLMIGFLIANTGI